MIGTVVADDDSSMRKKARLQEDEGVLPAGFEIPNFLADPSHRIKVFGKYIYKLKNLPLKVSPVRNEHVVRLKQNWSYFIYTNRGKTIEEFQAAAMGPLLHMSNDHRLCNKAWCTKLQADEKGDEYKNKQDLDLNDKTDMEVFLQLREIIELFSTKEVLRESLSYDQNCSLTKLIFD